MFAPSTFLETYFGTAVPDPYRRLQNTKDAEVSEWMKAHSDHAHATLRALPGRAALLADLQRLDAATPSQVSEVVRLRHGAWVYKERAAGEAQHRIVMRDGLDAAPRVIFDPARMAGADGKAPAITFHRASPSGRRLLVGLAKGGSEDTTMHVFDVAGRRELVAPITRTDYAVPSWVDDDTIVFNRLQEMKPRMPPTARYDDSAAVMLDLRSGRLATLLSRAQAGGADIGPSMAPFVRLEPGSRHALATIEDGVRVDKAFYVAPADDALRGRAQWRRVADFSQRVAAAELQDDRLYLLSFDNAPRGKVLMLDLRRPRAAAVEWLPSGERVLTAIGAARDALYVEAREGNVKRLLRLPYEPRRGATRPAATTIALPFEGNFWLAGWESAPGGAQSDLDGVAIGMQSWTREPRMLHVQADGRARDTRLQPAAAAGDGADDLRVTEVLVAVDGVQVPLSIVSKHGTPLDGRNPLLLSAYASYGITLEPTHRHTRRTWLDRGGVLAYANPRGSGVYGTAWHDAGKQATKPNTWRDFIGCAQWLVAQRWTSPDRLAIEGGSAGGIVVGMSVMERPDLFAAAVPEVGTLDMITFETTANGPSNVPEFGSVKNEAGFRALLAMSAYHHVKPATAYPAMLFVHGVNDPRVDVWNSTKTAARMMAASTSGKPVLMRLDYDAGHGVGDSKAQTLERLADTYAFLFRQLGVALDEQGRPVTARAAKP